eukprot:PhM_4_TR18027/c12_g1_i1/m.93082
MKSVGEYHLTTLLGRGTYGDVRRAVSQTTGNEYACKTIARDLLTRHESGRRQVHREISILKLTEHKNIVQLHDVLITNNNIYVLMELVRGGSLLSEIEKVGALTEGRARAVFFQVANAVNYLHTQGIAHRDIKPENVLLTSEGVVKLTDFGLSNIQEVDQDGNVPTRLRLRSLCGTPNYVAPEVLRREGYNGFASDVWSCGVLLYVLLTGRLPFYSEAPQKLLEMIIEGKYPAMGCGSKDARDIVTKMLAVDVSKRPTMAEVLAHPWLQRCSRSASASPSQQRSDNQATSGGEEPAPPGADRWALGLFHRLIREHRPSAFC